MGFLRWFAVTAALCAVTFIWGLGVYRWHVFPYEQIKLTTRADDLPAASVPLSHWEFRQSLFREFSPKADVVMIGDSLTERADWSDIFPEIAIANRGVNGDTVSGALKRLDTIFSVNPSKAFIMLGINDLANKAPTEEVFRGYVQLVTAFKNRGIEVNVQSTLLCNDKKWPMCAQILPLIGDLNRRLSELSGVNFIDLNAALSDRGVLKSEFTDDGIHLTALGYNVWRREIARRIR
jgi:lysophospholipase L1-like esterase